MKVVFLEAPEAMIDERRRLGLDKRDEMWEGVLHWLPQPGESHLQLRDRFMRVVQEHTSSRGLHTIRDVRLYRADGDYRVPYLAFCNPDQRCADGAVGAELVVEIRIGDDETYQKLDFYVGRGAREILVLHADRRAELFRCVDGQLMIAPAGARGELESEVLGITLRTVEGKLRITWPEGSADI